MSKLDLNQLPFRKAPCWQGEIPTIEALDDAEIVQVYERNWHYRGVLADLRQVEQETLKQLANQHHSWLVNEI